MVKRSVIVILCLIGCITFGDAARVAQGSVIEARRSSSETLFLWDATPYVIALVRDHLLGQPGMRALESTALKSLSSRGGAARTRFVALRVLYQKTGAVSPIYGTPTFAGVEVVVLLRADKTVLRKNAAPWEAALAQGKVPKGLSLQVLGRLPTQSP